jgi:hypothetical protein
MFRNIRTIAAVIAVLPLVLVVAEITTRFDDWLRFGMPFFASADETQNLRIVDTLGVRGRPNGRFLHYHLDNYGFRGPSDVTVARRPGCERIMVLGASETFGISEPDGYEYPAQLSQRLNERGCTEVLNAAVPGMALPHIRYTWNHYWQQFAPDYVLIYPSPIFYLSSHLSRGPRVEALRDGAAERTPFRPRLVFLAHQAFSYPEVIQRRRVARFTREALAGVPDDSLWRDVPNDRLGLFISDLDSLSDDVRRAGATPVLMTHAMRFTPRPDPADSDILAAWRQFTPRATTNVMIAFEDRAAAETRALAARRGFPLADVACALTGQRARFSDYVHFTRAGAAIVADVAARVLRPGEDSLLAGNIANAHSGCADLPATATSRQRTPVRLDQLSQIK